MALFEQISDDIKKAMLAREKTKLEALRGIKKEFIEAKTAKGADGELTDEMAMKILQKMYKQRKDTAQIYIDQNRQDLAETELAEASIIESYLPKALSDEELTARCEQAGLRVNTLSSYYHETPNHADTRCLVVNYSGLSDSDLDRLETILKA